MVNWLLVGQSFKKFEWSMSGQPFTKSPAYSQVRHILITMSQRELQAPVAGSCYNTNVSSSLGGPTLHLEVSHEIHRVSSERRRA